MLIFCIVGSDEEAWELEKQEEEAALVLQQRMAAALDEEDFDVANFQVGSKILMICGTVH